MHKRIKNPLVTVYLVNHNYGKFLKQSVESVLKQNYKNYELIIIDDGSTDDSKLEHIISKAFGSR